MTLNTHTYYVKPIALKFRINPKIPILHFVNTNPTNFQSKISPGVMAGSHLKLWPKTMKIQY